MQSVAVVVHVVAVAVAVAVVVVGERCHCSFVSMVAAAAVDDEERA